MSIKHFEPPGGEEHCLLLAKLRHIFCIHLLVSVDDLRCLFTNL